MDTRHAAMTPAFDQESSSGSGHIDSSTRMVLAFACFGQMFLFETISSWQPYVVGFGIYLVMTVILRRDPVYSIIHAPRETLIQS